MTQEKLNQLNIYAVPVGEYFDKGQNACYIVYAPLSNVFFLSTPEEVENLERQAAIGEYSETLQKMLDTRGECEDSFSTQISTDTFCTLHILLNEKCNFKCSYCYSAMGRSNQELQTETIEQTLRYFLSAERKAVNDRTIMFMGGGEPTLSWPLLVESTLLAEEIAQTEDIKLFLSLTTNGSILNDEMVDFLKVHNFTVQISFEVLPDVQTAQRGSYQKVADNINRLCDAGVNNYVRATITEMNVGRICEMVEHCHKEMPGVKKLSCQQVVDREYFATTEIVDCFFDTYFNEFNHATALAKSYGIDLRSSSSHLLNYSKRERFCYNLLCLTPYGSLTTCPDISSPKEEGYAEALIGKVNGGVKFDNDAFNRITHGNIHTIDKCAKCMARWNCGSGCPSSRNVYSDEIFDAICNYYRRILTYSLMQALADKYQKATGRNMIEDIKQKLQ